VNVPTSDPIGQAIEAVEAPTTANVEIRFRTGRTALIRVPLDLEVQEAMDLVGYISTQLPNVLARARAQQSPLLIATKPLPPT
jgi:hypothetical protein